MTTLFTPLKLKHNEIKNRFIMGSMHTGLEEAKNGFQKMADFYSLRAQGGVGLIITGGFAPNLQGKVHPFASQLSFPWQVRKHKKITEAVHQAGGKICLQILHTGRYGYHPLIVSASGTKAPINRFRARKISKLEIKKTIFDYANCASLAEKAGYDGVEIMGSEGYFINQFLAPATNFRDDEYGGSFENRCRLALEIIQAVRAKVSKEFIIIYRLSMLDLIKEGQSFEEVITLAKKLESAGVDIVNSGIGWHETRVPTIATMVPRNAFTWITERIKKEIDLPVIATNRINNAQDANKIIDSGQADMICMARPFLADPDIVNKIKHQLDDQINTCIACNQACLDQIFKNQICSCLVNPKACHETEFVKPKNFKAQKIMVVGAGPAGVSFALEAAQLGHQVEIFEASAQIGGQFHLAKQIPGKEEFEETIRYYTTMLKEQKIPVHFNKRVNLEELQGFDHYVFSTGVIPRLPDIEGIEHPKVLSYPEAILDVSKVGKKVAVIGAGGIGFDVSELLVHPHSEPETLEEFLARWGVDADYQQRGALKAPTPLTPAREVYLLQRKATKHGKNLGKTTGWIHRQSLKQAQVKMLNNVKYLKIDDAGLHISIEGRQQILDVDNIVICAGQYSNNKLYREAKAKIRSNVHLIGGAAKAMEIDAKRAIDEGVRLAYQL